MSDRKEIVRHSAVAVLRLIVLALKRTSLSRCVQRFAYPLLDSTRESPEKNIDKAQVVENTCSILHVLRTQSTGRLASSMLRSRRVPYECPSLGYP